MTTSFCSPGGLVEGNTAVNIFPDLSRADHFQVVGDKSVVVKNNVGCAFDTGTTTNSNNLSVCKADTPKAFVAFDLTKQSLDLRPKPGGPLASQGAGSKP